MLDDDEAGDILEVALGDFPVEVPDLIEVIAITRDRPSAPGADGLRRDRPLVDAGLMTLRAIGPRR